MNEQVSSRKVAEIFDESHEKIMSDIELLIGRLMEIKDSPDEYFKESSYINEHNIRDKEYLLTQSGFMLVSMELSGSKSDEYKIKYIEEFNRMLHEIRQQSQRTAMENYKQGLKNLIKELDENERKALCHN